MPNLVELSELKPDAAAVFLGSNLFAENLSSWLDSIFFCSPKPLFVYHSSPTTGYLDDGMTTTPATHFYGKTIIPLFREAKSERDEWFDCTLEKATSALYLACSFDMNDNSTKIRNGVYHDVGYSPLIMPQTNKPYKRIRYVYTHHGSHVMPLKRDDLLAICMAVKSVQDEVKMDALIPEGWQFNDTQSENT